MSAILDRRETSVSTATSPVPVGVPASFGDWRREVARRGALPVIAVAGSRGKSTVVRLLDAIFTAGGLKTAAWTDAGVDVRGRHQGSELAAWGHALRRLHAGTLDVAVQELDWPTVHAVGLPPDAYPVAVVTNICVNSDRCLVRDETRLALRAYDRVRGAARRDGVLVLNGDDYAVAGTEVERETPSLLVGLNPESPLLRGHLSEGGRAAWLEGQSLVVGTATSADRLCTADQLDFALGGSAAFEVHNALFAAAIATVCGIASEWIAEALISFRMPPAAEGSFNLVPVAEAVAIVDRPTPSWFLRPLIRAIRHHPHRSLIVVAGRLDAVPEDDVFEVGRLLARVADAIVLHSEEDAAERGARLRQGLDTAAAPIVLLRTMTERQAVAKAIKLLRPADVLLVLSDQPAAARRALERAADASQERHTGELDPLQLADGVGQ
jgi:cyanophycin synthetase